MGRFGSWSLTRLSGTSRQGWQEKASDAVENEFLVANVWPTLEPTEQFSARSLGKTSVHVHAHHRGVKVSTTGAPGFVPPPPLATLAPDFAHLPMWPTLDSRGHHRAACTLARVLGRRGLSLENATARVCREAGGRVTTNVRVQDMDLLSLRQVDNRRLEVVVDGLPLFLGAQLAIDTTMVSPSGATGRLDVSAQQSAEQPWTKQGGGRSGLTPSWRSSTVAPGWWFWAAKKVDDGPKSLGSSWLH